MTNIVNNHKISVRYLTKIQEMYGRYERRSYRMNMDMNHMQTLGILAQVTHLSSL